MPETSTVPQDLAGQIKLSIAEFRWQLEDALKLQLGFEVVVVYKNPVRDERQRPDLAQTPSPAASGQTPARPG